MTQEELEQALAPHPFEKIAYFEQVGSTNDVVAEWARKGQRGLCLAAADEQTKGRGRAGRQWHTPPGSALAFSLLLPVEQVGKTRRLGRVNGLGALTVCDAIEELYGAQAAIKWPNDVLIEEKKVCGVLAEAHWQGEELQALVLGIGINVASPSVPPAEELSYPADSLEGALWQVVDRLKVLSSVVDNLVRRMWSIDSDEFLQEWEDRLAFRDERVQLSEPGTEPVEGQVLGLGENGSLRLRLESGAVQEFLIGEIQLRPVVDGSQLS